MTKFFNSTTLEITSLSDKAKVPTDAVPISDEQYQFLMDGIARRKKLAADADGNPVLIDCMLYSASTRGFYNSDVHSEIPADAVEVSDEEYAALFAAQSSGKRIVPGTGGKPVAADPEPPSEAEVRAQRNRRIAEVAWRYERHARELRLGLAPTDDIGELDAYVQALADLPGQEGFPGNVRWPEVPA